MKKTIFLLVSATIFSPGFIQEETAEQKSLHEFSNGHIAVASTGGMVKAGGLTVHYKYPASWKLQESGESEELIKLAQPDGYVSAVLVVTKENKASLQTISDKLKSGIPASASGVSARKVRIAGKDGSLLEFSNTVRRVDRSVYSHNLRCGFESGPHFVSLQFSVITKPGEANESADARYEKIRTLFDSMIASLEVE
jgi:hypothetical protein